MPARPSDTAEPGDAGSQEPVTRDAALDVLRALARDGGVLQLTGPPGAGKTGLIRQLLEEFPGGTTSPSLAAWPGPSGRLDAYGIVGQLAESDGRGALPATAAATAVATRGTDARTIGRHGGRWHDVGREARGTDDPDAPGRSTNGPAAAAVGPEDLPTPAAPLGGLPAALDLEDQRAEARQQACDLLVEVLAQPDRVVVVDDAHWADVGSLTAICDALEELQARGCTPRLVCAGRPLPPFEDQRPTVQRLFALAGARHVQLDPPDEAVAPGNAEPATGVPAHVRRRLDDLADEDEDLARVLVAVRVLSDAGPLIDGAAVAHAADLAYDVSRAALLRLADAGVLLAEDEAWSIILPPEGIDLQRDVAFAGEARRRAGLWTAAAAPGHPERAARVLLHVSPSGDPEIAEIFLRAARVALTRGLPGVATELLRRASSEPPQGEQHARLWLERAFVAEAEGDHERSEADAAHAAELATSADARAEASLALSRLQLRHGHEVESLETLERAADAADPAASARFVLEREIMSIGHGGEYQYAAATRRARRLRDAGLPEGSPVREQAETFLIPIDGTARQVAERLAPRIEHDVGTMSALPPITVLGSAWMLIRAELWETATLILDAAARQAERRGGSTLGGLGAERPVLRSLRALVELQVGDPRWARHLAEDAMGRLDAEDWTLPMRHGAGIAARVSTANGDPARALDMLARIQADHQAPFEVGASRPSLYVARAEAHLAAGDHDAALRDALTAQDLKLALTVPNPSGFPWAIVACAVLVARGEHVRALKVAREDLRGAQRWGAPLALSTALRAVAIASAPGERERVLRAALRRVEPTTLHLERVRVLWALADALEEIGRPQEAARTRARAVEKAGRFGQEIVPGAAGALLLDRQVAVSGATPRRSPPAAVGPPRSAPLADGDRPGLTSRQWEVAALLTEGLTNAAIAPRLEMGERTVQTHVRAILRRTDSTTRTEAAHKLRAWV